MALTSVGDLSQGAGLRRQSSYLKTEMERLNMEVTTGVTADATQHLSGNFAQLSDVEHDLTLLESQRLTTEQGRIEASVTQTSLERFQDEAQNLSSTALTLANSAGAPSYTSFANEAENALGAMISSLNTNVGGRSMFSGDEVSSRAIAPLDDFMSAISAAIAGSTSAADVNAAMDAFFDTPGGGFDTLIYQGGDAARGAIPLGEGESVSFDLRADDPAFRQVFKETAIAASLNDPGITLSTADKSELTAQVGERLLGSQDRLTDLRADVGFAESRIDRAATRISTETSGLEILRTELLEVDQNEAAVELEALQLQLETIYTLTSRLSRLSLVNFLS